MKKYIIFLLFPVMVGCNSKTNKPKIYYINSYHKGYASSDSIMEGIERVFENKNVQLKTFFMDTKRNSSPEFIASQTEKILMEIEEYTPDIILASDDNAVKYVVEPHFKNTNIPVLFCGVNWSASQYGLPTDNITGMLEVLPLKHVLTKMREHYPQAYRLLVLSENTTSERNNKQLLDTLYRSAEFNEVTYSLVNDFAGWQEAFLEGNESSDLIYIPTNGAIRNWNVDEAIAFVKENIKKPVVTCDDFMMLYATFGLTKVASEQGIWIAHKALEILNDKDVKTIKLVKNKKHTCWYNQELSKEIDFKLPEEELKKCNIID
jgi:ABC-type uncharacterized transport system substrate-binding protein